MAYRVSRGAGLPRKARRAGSGTMSAVVGQIGCATSGRFGTYSLALSPEPRLQTPLGPPALADSVAGISSALVGV